MADIHLHTPTGETIVHPEERVAELLHTGALSPETLFWREGMSEWRRIDSFQNTAQPTSRPATTALPKTRSLIEPDAGPPDAAPEGSTRLLPEAGPRLAASASNAEKNSRTVGRNRFRFRRSPEPLTTIVQVLLVICVCVTVLELAVAVVHYVAMASGVPAMDDSHGSLLAPKDSDNFATGNSEVSSVATDGTNAFLPADDGDEVGRLLEWLGWAVNLSLSVPYFMWLFRTVQNCRNFSSIMRFTPHWAVWCYFIPPMMFFRPLQVMQEVWKVSRNPRTWHNDRPSLFVGLWWALTLATAGLALSSWLHSDEAVTPPAQQFAGLLFIVLKIVQTAWYAIFITLVTQVIQKQNRVVRAARRKAEHGEPEDE